MICLSGQTLAANAWLTSKFFFLIVVLLILSLVFVAYLIKINSRINKKKNQIEQQLYTAQLNPHFIFNALSAIQSLIYRNDSELAGKYLSSLAKLIRSLLENSRVSLITMTQELTFLRSYLELQKIRFENRLDYSIDMEEGINSENVMVPPMLIQPVIEDEIEHGIVRLAGKSEISIRFTSNGKEVITEIGIRGLTVPHSGNVDTSNYIKHKALTEKRTEDRLKQISQSEKIEISFSIINSGQLDADDPYRLLTFTIPYYYK